MQKIFNFIKKIYYRIRILIYSFLFGLKNTETDILSTKTSASSPISINRYGTIK